MLWCPNAIAATSICVCQTVSSTRRPMNMYSTKHLPCWGCVVFFIRRYCARGQHFAACPKERFRQSAQHYVGSVRVCWSLPGASEARPHHQPGLLRVTDSNVLLLYCCCVLVAAVLFCFTVIRTCGKAQLCGGRQARK